jgi:hypothetical protein
VSDTLREQADKMTTAEIQDYIENSHWQFAKSMPQMPHWYTLRRNARDESEFERFVMHIRKVGYQETFGRTTYVYLNVGPWKYWTMGSPLDQTILINRAKIAQTSK